MRRGLLSGSGTVPVCRSCTLTVPRGALPFWCLFGTLKPAQTGSTPSRSLPALLAWPVFYAPLLRLRAKFCYVLPRAIYYGCPGAHRFSQKNDDFPGSASWGPFSLATLTDGGRDLGPVSV